MDGRRMNSSLLWKLSSKHWVWRQFAETEAMVCSIDQLILLSAHSGLSSAKLLGDKWIIPNPGLDNGQ
jgi:hypothetical protein